MKILKKIIITDYQLKSASSSPSISSSVLYTSNFSACFSVIAPLSLSFSAKHSPSGVCVFRLLCSMYTISPLVNSSFSDKSLAASEFIKPTVTALEYAFSGSASKPIRRRTRVINSAALIFFDGEKVLSDVPFVIPLLPLWFFEY